MDPFVAEIRIFPFSFPPKGWAFCNGQLMPISQNTALFSLLGVTYGGDGKSVFGLPDLQGNVAMHPGQGPGSYHDLGEMGGTPLVALEQSQIPLHTHTLQGGVDPSDLYGPNAQNPAILSRGTNGAPYKVTSANLTPMAPQALTSAGEGLPHNNMMPTLTLNFCIALQGDFPPRS